MSENTVNGALSLRKHDMRLVLLTLACAQLLPSLALPQGAASAASSLPSPEVSSAPERSIALLRVAESHRVQVRDSHSGLFALGAIGGAIKAGADAQHSEALATTLNEHHAQMAAVMEESLRQAFQAQHLRLDYLPDQFPVPATGKKGDDYSGIQTDKSAILNVWFGALGYETSSEGCTPWVIVHARLLDPVTKGILYEQVFDVGRKALSPKVTFIPLESGARFASYDDMMSHTDAAIESLSGAVSTAGHSIATEVEKVELVKTP